MSTRIVEKGCDHCRTDLEKVLDENGYKLSENHPVDAGMRSRYELPDKGGMLYRPALDIKIEPMNDEVTSIDVSFAAKWGLQASITIFWAIIGLGPIVLLIRLSKSSGGNPVWWAVFGILAAWSIFVIGRVALATDRLEKHWKKTEGMIWERLDLEGTLSHETNGPSGVQISFYSTLKTCSLVLLIFIGVVISGVSQGSIIRTKSGQLVFAISMFLFLLIGFLVLFSGWLESSWKLPHRYHWKIRLGMIYLNWWLTVCFPGLSLAAFSYLRGWSLSYHGFVYFPKGIWLSVIFATIVIMAAYVMIVIAMLKMLKGEKKTESAGDYLAGTSTRYEEIHGKDDPPGIQKMLNSNAIWAWSIFLLFTTLWYVNAGFLVFFLFSTAAGMAGIVEHSPYWPAIMPDSGRMAAVEAFILISLALVPVVITIVHAVRGRLNLHGRLRMGKEIAESSGETGLPDEDIANLENRLGAESMKVALIPATAINMQVERASLFRKDFLLWVTSGARKQLSREELRAMLLHECGHAEFIKQSRWRDFASFLAPWGPGYLDLAVDLYGMEREADRYAVEKMGTAGPLLSALNKMKANRDALEKERGGRMKEAQRWLSENEFKTLWSLGWTGYLYPDIDNRINWLAGEQH